MKIQSSCFGATEDGREVTRYTLTNAHGSSIAVMNWGATLLDVNVPDRTGKLANVNLSFESLEPYLGQHPYFGSTVGRFGNRIREGRFTIDGREYQVTQNHGQHHLHGGKVNFSHQLWQAESFERNGTAAVRFTLVSPDGQEGFPGTLTTTVEYRWNGDHELGIDYTATTDAPTHVNLTNHSYWNLNGASSGSVLDHVLQIEANRFLDIDNDLIPTGETNHVEDTPLDFRTPTRVGDRIDQLPHTKGYDHCYVIRGETETLRKAARLVDLDSGRTLEIETTQPGMQLYTANHLPGDESSAGHGRHEALCLETQHYPDAPNHDSFPSTLLRPGQTLRETTLHHFGTE